MSRGEASTHARQPDASTLGVTAFNVGMIQEDAFKLTQDEKLQELALHVATWLQEGPAVVGLNEIHPRLVEKLALKLELNLGIATNDSNSLLWRTPQ